MRAEDVPAVKSLEIAADLSGWSECEYLSEIRHPSALTVVARAGGEVVGFAIARLITISNHADSDSGPLFEMEMNNLAVASSFRRSGLATRIFGELLKRLPSGANAEIFLEVREQNTAARAFYRALGLTETAIRKNFYRHPPDNAIVMSGTVAEIETNLILKSNID